MGKIKANEIIISRNNLSEEISKYWGIIKMENVVNKNYKRNYDLKSLYDMIKGLSEKRIQSKLKILCINMGLKKFSDLSATSNQINIFRLSEITEQKVQLLQIKTINPKLKTTKGKANLKVNEVLTQQWVKARVEELDLEIISIKKKLTEFNESAELEDDAPSYLTA